MKHSVWSLLVVLGCGPGSSGTGATSSDSSSSTSTSDGSDSAGSSTGTDTHADTDSAGECGDGTVDQDEECDEGPANGDGKSACTGMCTSNTCGDGYLHLPSEECDPGAGDTPCSSNCAIEVLPVVGIALGFDHTCAIVGGGALECFGAGADGRLGYGNTDNVGDDELPGAVGFVDVGAPVAVASLSDLRTCVVLETGDARCWGDAKWLGYGGSEAVGDDEPPSAVPTLELGGSASQIAAGWTHTCALMSGGGVRCWGSGASGKLGYANIEDVGDDEAPGAAGDVELGAPATQVVAGDDHTCALLMTGSVRCWGHGGAGALGMGSFDAIGDDETPAEAGTVPVGGDVEWISAGRTHTCVVLSGGSVRCWGSGEFGQLGYPGVGVVGVTDTPADLGDVDLGAAATRVAAGSSHTCALLTSGAVRCWGRGEAGRLGLGSTEDVGDDENPAEVGDVDVGGTVVDVAAGGAHTCALLESGELRCWGSGAWGALGYGNTENVGDDETPESAGNVPIY